MSFSFPLLFEAHYFMIALLILDEFIGLIVLFYNIEKKFQQVRTDSIKFLTVFHVTRILREKFEMT